MSQALDKVCQVTPRTTKFMNNRQAKLSFAVSPLGGAIAPLPVSGQFGVLKSSYCFADGLEGIAVVVLMFFILCYNSDSHTQ